MLAAAVAQSAGHTLGQPDSHSTSECCSLKSTEPHGRRYCDHKCGNYSSLTTLACSPNALLTFRPNMETFSINDGVRRIGDDPFLLRQSGCNLCKIPEVTAQRHWYKFRRIISCGNGDPQTFLTE